MKHLRRHKGTIALTLIVAVASVSVLLLAGYMLALSIATGVGSGAFTLWITRGIREYPNDYVDISDTD